MIFVSSCKFIKKKIQNVIKSSYNWKDRNQRTLPRKRIHDDYHLDITTCSCSLDQNTVTHAALNLSKIKKVYIKPSQIA